VLVHAAQLHDSHRRIREAIFQFMQHKSITEALTSAQSALYCTYSIPTIEMGLRAPSAHFSESEVCRKSPYSALGRARKTCAVVYLKFG
jgi:hypothetical protein